MWLVLFWCWWFDGRWMMVIRYLIFVVVFVVVVLVVLMLFSV